jgi:septal ring factor EnvC (AmiA/AmiB activator)
MVFGLFKKKEKKATDPLAAFDEMIESLERQGAAARKSAATLIAVRSELRRDEDRFGKRIEELASKRSDDQKVNDVLARDRGELQRMLARTKEALLQAERDSSLLMEAAEHLTRQLSALKEERQGARARFSGGLEVSAALKSQAADFDRVMKLDAARDEVEKAHALAEIYRDDADR